MLGPASSARSEVALVLAISWRSLSFASTASSRLEELAGLSRALILLALRSFQYPRKQQQLKWP